MNEDEIEPSGPVGRFTRKTAMGAVLHGVALGLQDIFDPNDRETTVAEAPAPGDPDVPRPVEAILDPDDPSQSSVLVRSESAEQQ